ncbi:hypothetical protein WIW50_11990 [Flavobacteriaceae bacterium 3-367]|uniref:hypothetical protein n=1 Tax=Eudoraea algarum TaxID=3417568 RepID=UPI003275A1DB
MSQKGKKIDEWRIRYAAFRKAERRKTILATCIVVIGFVIAYYWWTDDLKFFGRKTAYVSGVVTNERMVHWGRGNYYQEATCDYMVEGKKYTTDFEIWKNRLLVRVGDSVVLKIALSNPKISRLH